MHRFLRYCSALFLLCSLSYVHAMDTPSTPNVPSSELTHPITQHTAESTETYFWRMILTLAAIVVLLLLTLWFFRRIGRGRLGGKFGSGTSIKVLERRGLSPKSSLYLVEVGNKRMLIAESQINVELVGSVEFQASEQDHSEHK